MEFDDVQSIEDCEELATVDAYNEDEQASGWLTCLEEVFDGVEEVKLAGDVVKLEGFDLKGYTIVAVCGKNRKKLMVTLDSIELIGPTRAQALWREAWLRWQG
jgi:hypothetical protein